MCTYCVVNVMDIVTFLVLYVCLCILLGPMTIYLGKYSILIPVHMIVYDTHMHRIVSV